MKIAASPLSRKKFNFDERDDNNFELLVDGGQFFPEMLKAIQAANQYILLEQYLVESGDITTRFINALIEASKRKVEVYVLLDDFGSQALNSRDRRKLIASGIQLRFYNPIRIKQLYRSLFRNHRKLLLVDSSVAFVGGAGITDEFDTEKNQTLGWHEVMLKIQGPVLEDWQALFLYTWSINENQQLQLPKLEPEQQGRYSGQVVCSTGLGRQEITRALIRKVRNTEERVWLSTPYFVTTWAVRRSLRYAARMSVDVRVLVPGPHNDHPWVGYASRYFYTRLMRAGVRIYEYQPRFNHSKIQLCDDWVSIGSSNLDRWNNRWNLDANQVISSAEFANEVRELLEQDFKDSEELNLEQWEQRPILQKVKEWFVRIFVRVLERISK